MRISLSRLARSLSSGLLASALFLSLAPAAFSQAEPTPLGATKSRQAPYSYIGRLTFDAGKYTYIGSGTLVTTKGVLTAGHNLYDEYEGFSTSILFQRGKYNSQVLSSARPNYIYLLSSYSSYTDNYGSESVRAFSRDMGGLTFRTAV